MFYSDGLKKLVVFDGRSDLISVFSFSFLYVWMKSFFVNV